MAAVLLLADRLLRERGLDELPATGRAICKAVGASRSHAYETLRRLEVACLALDERRTKVATSPSPEARLATVAAVRDFAFDNPGSVADRGVRRRYSDSFRNFVTGLLSPGQIGEALTVEQLAEASGVPLGTLKQWLCGESPEEHALKDGAARPASELSSQPEIATIISEYEQWQGDFTSFCEHLRTHRRLPYGRTFIASVLAAVGRRTPKRRKQQGYAPWSPDTFRRLFPGAQWLGDGTTLVMELNGQRFPFNLEALGDVSSNALVGLTVSDSEDQEALLAAFAQGLQTIEGAHPLALTLDNKPCNHTARVKDEVSPTTIVPATPGRGQAKAPLEGAFGLFAQTAPPLVVAGDCERELARSILRLIVTLWAWTRNGKPRRRLGGRSPADFYGSARPDEHQIADARAWIAELKSRADKARATAERRADPVRRQILEQALAELAIGDPEHRLAVSLARYSVEAILRGVAIFKAKRQRNTLPATADPGRYLGGIIRNVDSELELLAMADHLLDLRLRHKQLSLAPLERQLAELQAEHSPEQLPFSLLGGALAAEREIDFRFFSRHARDALQKLGNKAANLLPHLVRIVSGTFDATKRRRAELIALLTQVVAET